MIPDEKALDLRTERTELPPLPASAEHLAREARQLEIKLLFAIYGQLTLLANRTIVNEDDRQRNAESVVTLHRQVKAWLEAQGVEDD